MEQLTNSPIDAKISIGMDKELKTLMESEAKQLGVKLSVYARSIMKNRSGKSQSYKLKMNAYVYYY